MMSYWLGVAQILSSKNPTAGAMKIFREWMYYPTIHQGNFLQNNSSSWALPAMVSTTAYGPSAAVPLKGAR
jgi:hypothetical protein